MGDHSGSFLWGKKVETASSQNG